MRLLIVAIACAAGCYEAKVADCQFTCNSGTDCPSGTTCIASFCQSGATDICRAAPDDATADDVGDAPNVDCAGAPPPPSECTIGFMPPGTCAALCAVADLTDMDPQDAARQKCTASGWNLAVLDSTPKLDSVPDSGDGLSLYWVDATFDAPTTTWRWRGGAPVDQAAWINGVPTPGFGNECALIETPADRLRDGECALKQRFICAFTPIQQLTP